LFAFGYKVDVDNGGDNADASISFNLKSGNIKPCDRQDIKTCYKTWLSSACQTERKNVQGIG